VRLQLVLKTARSIWCHFEGHFAVSCAICALLKQNLSLHNLLLRFCLTKFELHYVRLRSLLIKIELRDLCYMLLEIRFRILHLRFLLSKNRLRIFACKLSIWYFALSFEYYFLGPSSGKIAKELKFSSFL